MLLIKRVFLPSKSLLQRDITRSLSCFLFTKPDVHTNRDGFTPLHAAAASGDEKIARLLIAYGFKVNARDDNEEIERLSLGSSGGYHKVARELIKHGARITVGDFGGSSPLHIAASEGHMNMVKLLVKHLKMLISEPVMVVLLFTELVLGDMRI